jgi:lysophospholipase L1-like esterase
MKYVCSLVLALSVIGQAAEPAKAPAAPAAPARPKVILPPQAPDVAAQKLGPDGKPNAGFLAAHARFLEIAKKGDTGVLFLGDSITAGWASKKDIWEKSFGAYKPANFGIGGDRTQHVLWRITNGELDGHKPKAVVLMIGTNNSGSDKPEGTAHGVQLIVEHLRAKLPEAKILLLAVFPRGAGVANNRGRDTNNAVNAIIAKLHDGQHVHYLDIGPKFLEADGTLTKEVMPDLLHLSAKGYQIWADAIAEPLAGLMK